MIKISNTESKTTPAKKNIQLKNISVKDLRLIDTDTGEDISRKLSMKSQMKLIRLISKLLLNFQMKLNKESWCLIV